jgi:hypothetical protein
MTEIRDQRSDLHQALALVGKAGSDVAISSSLISDI